MRKPLPMLTHTKDNGSALLHLLAYNTGKGSQLDPCWHQNYHVTFYQQQRNTRRRRWKLKRERREERVRGMMRWKIDTDGGGGH